MSNKNRRFGSKHVVSPAAVRGPSTAESIIPPDRLKRAAAAIAAALRSLAPAGQPRVVWRSFRLLPGGPMIRKAGVPY